MRTGSRINQVSLIRVVNTKLYLARRFYYTLTGILCAVHLPKILTLKIGEKDKKRGHTFRIRKRNVCRRVRDERMWRKKWVTTNTTRCVREVCSSPEKMATHARRRRLPRLDRSKIWLVRRWSPPVHLNNVTLHRRDVRTSVSWNVSRCGRSAFPRSAGRDDADKKGSLIRERHVPRAQCRRE